MFVHLLKLVSFEILRCLSGNQMEVYNFAVSYRSAGFFFSAMLHFSSKGRMMYTFCPFHLRLFPSMCKLLGTRGTHCNFSCCSLVEYDELWGWEEIFLFQFIAYSLPLPLTEDLENYKPLVSRGEVTYSARVAWNHDPATIQVIFNLHPFV